MEYIQGLICENEWCKGRMMKHTVDEGESMWRTELVVM
jgi:hypothetical protein